MAKLRHFAMAVPNTDQTAKFYEQVFGMKRVRESASAILLSDGVISLAILDNKTSHEALGAERAPPFRRHRRRRRRNRRGGRKERRGLRGQGGERGEALREPRATGHRRQAQGRGPAAGPAQVPRSERRQVRHRQRSARPEFLEAAGLKCGSDGTALILRLGYGGSGKPVQGRFIRAARPLNRFRKYRVIMSAAARHRGSHPRTPPFGAPALPLDALPEPHHPGFIWAALSEPSHLSRLSILWC